MNESDEATEERVARNESTFREINERVEDLAADHAVPPAFVCECDRTDCAELLSVPLDVYEGARTAPRRFIVAAGHERLEFERVVDRGDGWVVVEKTGVAGVVAAEEDPRRPSSR